ncbi:nitrous oxide reductase family maturation protein NosD [Halobacillus sp. MO56]
MKVLFSLLFFSLWFVPSVVYADTIKVSEGEDLQAIMDGAEPGDEILLEKGVYSGPFVIRESIILQGEKGAKIAGTEKGFVLKVTADDVTVEGLIIEKSGSQNAGISVAGNRVHIKRNTIGNVFNGVEVKEAYAPIIENNIISSYTDDRHKGFGIYLVDSPHAQVTGNQLSHLQDGVYVSFSNLCQVTGNSIRKARYGVHAMDSTSVVINDNEVFESRNGLMIMQSYEVRIKGNDLHDNTLLDGAGIFMFDTFSSQIKNNRIVDNRKGIYLENAIGNDISFNKIAGNHLGLDVGEASKDNRIFLNNFLSNNKQVVTTIESENDFFVSEHGNYWDNQRHITLDGDNQVDFAYKSGDAFHHMIAEEPLLQAFSGSPAIQMWNAIEQFTPIPSDTFITDPYPLAEPAPINRIGTETEALAEGKMLTGPALFFSTLVVFSGALIITAWRRK